MVGRLVEARPPDGSRTRMPGAGMERPPFRDGPVQGTAPSLRGVGRTASVTEAWGEGWSFYSCTSQTVPSGGAATVAEYGWPCQGVSSASTPPRLPTPDPP